MIKINLKTMELIDDAEHTPGYSRKFINFKYKYLPIIIGYIKMKGLEKFNLVEIGDYQYIKIENDIMYYKYKG